MRNIDMPSLDDRSVLSPPQRRPPHSFSQRLEDRQFLEMEQAFRATGGLVGGDELARRLRRHLDQPISTLARWIVERQALSVTWQAQTLIPMFQFEPSAMTLRPSVTAAARELNGVFDAWDLALWFARPNGWLLDCAPVDVIAVDAAAVLGAARADRFIALG